MQTTLQIIFRQRVRRLAISLAFSALLVWIGTYVLLKLEAPVALIWILAVVTGLAVLMQTLSPGKGLGRVRFRSVDEGSPDIVRAVAEMHGLPVGPVVASTGLVDSAALPSLDYLTTRINELIRAERSESRHSDFGLVVLELPEAPFRRLRERSAAFLAERLPQVVRGGDSLAQLGPVTFAIAVTLSERAPEEVFAAGYRLASACASEVGIQAGVAMYERGMSAADLISKAILSLQQPELGIGIAERAFPRDLPFRSRRPTGPKGSRSDS